LRAAERAGSKRFLFFSAMGASLHSRTRFFRAKALAEKAVREAVAITEREALKLKVIDLIAASMPDLLEKIDGRTVKLPKGTVTLATKVDPAIIGGVVARIGSTVYDGSVTTQLQKMKQKLVESV